MSKKRTILTLGIAGCLLVAASVVVRGASSSSANFELERQTTPTAGDDSFSTNYHLVGVAPQDASGVVRTSGNFELETIFVPPTFDPVDTTPPVILTGPTVTYISSTSALVEWTTDEITGGDVDFGLTLSYGNNAAQTGSFSTLHQVALTGLSASMLYNYRVNSTDPYSNGPTTSANFQFTTLGVPDVSGPVITDTVTPTSTQSVDITFTTDEVATTTLDHGATVGLGTPLPDNVFRTSHTRTLSGLAPGATHFYEITATDPSGNNSITGVQSFNVPDDVTITTTILPNGRVGDVYSELVVATGGVGALTWTLDSGTLPQGVVLIASTGELSGIPSTTGVHNFDVRVTDNGSPASTAVISLTLTIDAQTSGGGGSDDGGCSTGGGANLLGLFVALLSVIVLVWRRRVSDTLLE